MNKKVALIPADYADWMAGIGFGQQPYARSGIDKLIDNGESKAVSGKCHLQVGGEEKGEQA